MIFKLQGKVWRGHCLAIPSPPHGISMYQVVGVDAVEWEFQAIDIACPYLIVH
jgi:hypothetical protein